MTLLSILPYNESPEVGDHSTLYLFLFLFFIFCETKSYSCTPDWSGGRGGAGGGGRRGKLWDEKLTGKSEKLIGYIMEDTKDRVWCLKCYGLGISLLFNKKKRKS